MDNNNSPDRTTRLNRDSDQTFRIDKNPNVNKDPETIRIKGPVIHSGHEQTTSGSDTLNLSANKQTSAGQATGVGVGSTITVKNRRFTIISLLSETSGEAQVYLAEEAGKKFVFKYYYPNFRIKPEILEKLIAFTHPDIIALLDYGEYKGRFYELQDFAAGGALGGYLPIRDEAKLRIIIRDGVEAMHCCHEKGIIHRDIKPDNIFYKNADGTGVLIGDFGISSKMDIDRTRLLTSQSMTVGYSAPELYGGLDGKAYVGKEVDYYALGITLIHLWTGENPFKELGGPHAVMNITLSGNIPLPKAMPESIKTLVKGLTTFNYRKRWGYAEVKRWFDGEIVPVYQEKQKQKIEPLLFTRENETDIYAHSPVELAGLMEQYPEIGKKHLYRGVFDEWLKKSDAIMFQEIMDIVEIIYPQNHEAGLLKAIYTLDTERGFKTAKGVICRTAGEIGLAIEKEADFYEKELATNSESPLYIFLDTRKEKEFLDLFREIIKAYTPRAALHKIILELQGGTVLQFENSSFHAPAEFLDAPDAIKEMLASALHAKDSKCTLWLSANFSEYENALMNYQKEAAAFLDIIYYLFEEKAPYYFSATEKIYNVDDFKTMLKAHLDKAGFLAEFCNPAGNFRIKTAYWLMSRHEQSYSEIIFPIFYGYLEKEITAPALSKDNLLRCLEALGCMMDAASAMQFALFQKLLAGAVTKQLISENEKLALKKKICLVYEHEVLAKIDKLNPHAGIKQLAALNSSCAAAINYKKACKDYRKINKFTRQLVAVSIFSALLLFVFIMQFFLKAPLISYKEFGEKYGFKILVDKMVNGFASESQLQYWISVIQDKGTAFFAKVPFFGKIPLFIYVLVIPALLGLVIGLFFKKGGACLVAGLVCGIFIVLLSAGINTNFNSLKNKIKLPDKIEQPVYDKEIDGFFKLDSDKKLFSDAYVLNKTKTTYTLKKNLDQAARKALIDRYLYIANRNEIRALSLALTFIFSITIISLIIGIMRKRAVKWLVISLLFTSLIVLFILLVNINNETTKQVSTPVVYGFYAVFGYFLFYTIWGHLLMLAVCALLLSLAGIKFYKAFNQKTVWRNICAKVVRQNQ